MQSLRSPPGLPRTAFWSSSGGGTLLRPTPPPTRGPAALTCHAAKPRREESLELRGLQLHGARRSVPQPKRREQPQPGPAGQNQHLSPHLGRNNDTTRQPGRASASSLPSPHGETPPPPPPLPPTTSRSPRRHSVPHPPTGLPARPPSSRRLLPPELAPAPPDELSGATRPGPARPASAGSAGRAPLRGGGGGRRAPLRGGKVRGGLVGSVRQADLGRNGAGRVGWCLSRQKVGL